MTSIEVLFINFIETIEEQHLEEGSDNNIDRKQGNQRHPQEGIHDQH